MMTRDGGGSGGSTRAQGQDALGRVNQLFAARANKVYLMTAGLALDIKTAGARPYTDMG